jgi:hypothetical protein
MLKMIAAVTLGAPIALAATVAGTGVMVVDVNPSDGPHIVVPVPLLAAQVASGFLPEEARRELDLTEHLDGVDPAAFQELIAALREAPDGELVRVEDGDELVIVAKRGDTLEVMVDGISEQVDVTVPLNVVARVVGDDGRIRIGEVIRELRHTRFTNLVDVRDGEDRVKVWVF